MGAASVPLSDKVLTFSTYEHMKFFKTNDSLIKPWEHSGASTLSSIDLLKDVLCYVHQGLMEHPWSFPHKTTSFPISCCISWGIPIIRRSSLFIPFKYVPHFLYDHILINQTNVELLSLSWLRFKGKPTNTQRRSIMSNERSDIWPWSTNWEKLTLSIFCGYTLYAITALDMYILASRNIFNRDIQFPTHGKVKAIASVDPDSVMICHHLMFLAR